MCKGMLSFEQLTQWEFQITKSNTQYKERCSESIPNREEEDAGRELTF